MSLKPNIPNVIEWHHDSPGLALSSRLQSLHPEQVNVEVCHFEELDRRRGLTSALDEMWSYVAKQAPPRWLWHAMDHHTGQVLASVFGRRKDDVFLKLQQLLAPLGITKFYTDGWGAYARHLEAE